MSGPLLAALASFSYRTLHGPARVQHGDLVERSHPAVRIAPGAFAPWEPWWPPLADGEEAPLDATGAVVATVVVAGRTIHRGDLLADNDPLVTAGLVDTISWSPWAPPS